MSGEAMKGMFVLLNTSPSGVDALAMYYVCPEVNTETTIRFEK
ncbi:hypothetical protein [Paenibacillus auburnensis]|nr:hypothetical protein [Paenibacillus auburnensis]